MLTLACRFCMVRPYEPYITFSLQPLNTTLTLTPAPVPDPDLDPASTPHPHPALAVAHRRTCEVWLEGDLERGIVPDSCVWTAGGGAGEDGFLILLEKMNLELLRR